MYSTWNLVEGCVRAGAVFEQTLHGRNAGAAVGRAVERQDGHLQLALPQL